MDNQVSPGKVEQLELCREAKAQLGKKK